MRTQKWCPVFMWGEMVSAVRHKMLMQGENGAVAFSDRIVNYNKLMSIVSNELQITAPK
jgi:hypothetical protein